MREKGIVAEELVSSRRPFEGKLVNVRVDTVRLDNGDEREREVVEHPGAVAVLPVLPNGDVVLVRQYRHAVGRALLEVPAGTREPNEPEIETGFRELREETGYQADQLRELIRFLVSPGWANEELVVYIADDVTPGTASPEDDESLELVQVKLPDLRGLIQSGEIADSKTIISILAWTGLSLASR